MSRLLFLCNNNSARSQIAEGFAKEIASEEIEIMSAGLQVKKVHLKAIEVMAEEGIDISRYESKPLEKLSPLKFDVMVTLCDSVRENCHNLPGYPAVVHWSIPEPIDAKRDEKEVLSQFRKVRDEIRSRIRDFFEDGYFHALSAYKHSTELILDNLEHGLIASDYQRRIIYFNRAAEAITGYSREDLLWRDCYEVFEGGGLCGGKCPFREAIQQFEHISYDVEITSKDGEQRRLETSLILMKDNNGKIVGCINSFQDITRLFELERRLGEMEQFAGIIGKHPTMLDVFELIRQVAKNEVTVLIQGESGTGKELVASAIHNEGNRADKPFVAVNCGGLPAGTLESELFGHVKGAFTGATRDKKGRFELADSGTIFLDEAGELSSEAQTRLLRVLQEGTFERVGGESTINVDVRIIAATNKDLKREIASGNFRKDLYYRLCVVPINLPPLRERKTDIPLLTKHFLKQAATQAKRTDLTISNKALSIMMEYDWPGNVRELQSAIKYSLVKCEGKVINPSHLPNAIFSNTESITQKGKRKRKLDLYSVQRALQETNGNKTKAAQILGVSRSTLYRFLSENKI